MIKKGKKACDWCGKTFQKKTPFVEYEGGASYHHKCLQEYDKKGID